MKIILSAFACSPKYGSEPSYGYYWAEGLANRGVEVYCLTRYIFKDEIECRQTNKNIHYIYIKLPFGLERLYHFKTFGLYVYYLIWQWVAYKKALRLHRQHQFDLVHHITFGSVQLGSFMYNLNIPFVFGPSGGGQMPPESLSKFFGDSWKLEEKRRRVSNMMLKYNPSCYKMIKRCDALLVSNADTRILVEKFYPKRIFDVLDTTLRDDFIPKTCPNKTIKDKIKLLWIGRIFPRKGILLAVEVMRLLKNNPSIELTVVGDGPFMKKLKEKVSLYDLANRITIVGNVEYGKIADYYLSHHYLLFTSLRDAVGVQMLEAMAYGLPVIGLDIHGQSAVIQETRGIKVKVGSGDEIAANLALGIEKLLLNKLDYEALSKDAYNFATTHSFSKKIDFVFENVYKSITPLLK